MAPAALEKLEHGLWAISRQQGDSLHQRIVCPTRASTNRITMWCFQETTRRTDGHVDYEALIVNHLRSACPFLSRELRHACQLH